MCARGVAIAAEQAVIGAKLVGPVALRIDGDRIVDVAVGGGPAFDGVTIEPGTLTAGLVDVQVNGAVGHDLATADDEGWRAVADHLLAHGVTSFCPTAITAPVAELVAFAGRAREAASVLAGGVTSRPLGAHLEGPFISPQHCGAHDPAFVVAPTPGSIESLVGAADGGGIAMVTLAPEVDGCLDAVARLTAAGVAVSIGHTGATDADVEAAIAAGASWVTHLFNAQRPFHHREPGVIGHALIDERLRCGLIADGHHVADTAVRLAFRAGPGRIALVSDAMAAAGMPAGRSRIGRRAVTTDDGDVPRLDDGTLAGSVLHLDEAVRNVVGLGLEPAAAVEAATAVPADGIGRSDLGRLAVGARADVVRWDGRWRVVDVWSAGRRRVAG